MPSFVEQYRPKRQSGESSGHPLPDNFVAFVPYACTQLNAPFFVRFNYQVQDDYVSVEDKKRGKGKVSQAKPTYRHSGGEDDESAPFDTVLDTVLVTLVLTSQGDIAELIFQGCRLLPCLLLKVIELSVPYQPRLTRLSMRRCELTPALLRDVASIARLAALTEVLLDDSPVSEAAPGELLGGLPALRRLSLDRCKVGDEGTEGIAAALAHPLPASLSLRSLSLASDGVGDRGARALGLAMRSNRRLVHLNLAGNRLTDDGLEALLACLEEFPLSSDELAGKRRRLMDHHRARCAAYAQLMSMRDQTVGKGAAAAAAAATARRFTRTWVGARGPAPVSMGVSPSTTLRAHEALLKRAEALTEEAVGPFQDPFSSEETRSRDGGACCVGNTTLSYLNVAYNELGYRSAVQLARVLRYQQEIARSGLVRVVLEGNPLPLCAELREVQKMLKRQLTMHQRSLISGAIAGIGSDSQRRSVGLHRNRSSHVVKL